MCFAFEHFLLFFRFIEKLKSDFINEPCDVGKWYRKLPVRLFGFGMSVIISVYPLSLFILGDNAHMHLLLSSMNWLFV